MNAVTVLRLGVAISMIIFGIDEFLHPWEWTDYIPKLLRNIINFSLDSTMKVHGAINLVLGVLMLFGLYSPTIVWIVFFWWISILPFAFIYNWRIGIKDLSIVFSLLALLLMVS